MDKGDQVALLLGYNPKARPSLWEESSPEEIQRENPQRYPRNLSKGTLVTSLEVSGITLGRYRGHLLEGCKRRVSEVSKAPLLTKRQRRKTRKRRNTHESHSRLIQ